MDRTIMLKTSVCLASLPEIHKRYLDNLKNTKRKADEQNQRTLYEQTLSTARGYIKALENTGTIKNGSFKTLWCWFTL